MAENPQTKIETLKLAEQGRNAFLRYKETHSGSKLGLIVSAGTNYIDNWFCTDLVPAPDKNIYYCDMTKDFYFESETFDYVYTEHGIEHITFEGCLKFLSECRRVLKKGGILRIVTPSLEKWINYYTVDNDMHDRATATATKLWLKTAEAGGLYSKCLVFNNALRNWGHTLLYDFATLNEVLQGLNFTSVIQAELEESPHPELRGLERHVVKAEYTRMELMVIEAEK